MFGLRDDLHNETDYASDLQETLGCALAALNRCGYSSDITLWIPQPLTMGGLHMRQENTLRELRKPTKHD